MGISRFTKSRFKTDIKPVLYAGAGITFLRYAYSRFKMVEAEILKNRPMRNGRRMPVEAKDFSAKSALFCQEKHSMIIL